MKKKRLNKIKVIPTSLQNDPTMMELSQVKDSMILLKMPLVLICLIYNETTTSIVVLRILKLLKAQVTVNIIIPH